MSFGRDFEQQLSFYVEARSMFCNLEPVLVQLIHVRIFIHSLALSIHMYRSLILHISVLIWDSSGPILLLFPRYERCFLKG